MLRFAILLPAQVSARRRSSKQTFLVVPSAWHCSDALRLPPCPRAPSTPPAIARRVKAGPKSGTYLVAAVTGTHKSVADAFCSFRGFGSSGANRIFTLPSREPFNASASEFKTYDATTKKLCVGTDCPAYAVVECVPVQRLACVPDKQLNIGFGNDGTSNVGTNNHGNSNWGNDNNGNVNKGSGECSVCQRRRGTAELCFCSAALAWPSLSPFRHTPPLCTGNNARRCIGDRNTINDFFGYDNLPWALPGCTLPAAQCPQP